MNLREILASKTFKKIMGLILLFGILFSIQVLINKNEPYGPSQIMSDMGKALSILVIIFVGDWVFKKISPIKHPEKDKS